MSDVRRLALVGAGGHASDVLSAVEAINRHGATIEVVGLVADEEPDPSRFAGRSVAYLGGVDVLTDHDVHYVLAVGWPWTKRALLARVGPGARAATVVHPSAEVGVRTRLGQGTVVLDGAHLSANVELGEHVLVSYLASVGHDTVVGTCSSVMPGAHVAGDVRLGPDVTVGAGAIVLQGRSVGEAAVIGAGAVVTRDVAAGVTVVGAPARET